MIGRVVFLCPWRISEKNNNINNLYQWSIICSSSLYTQIFIYCFTQIMIYFLTTTTTATKISMQLKQWRFHDQQNNVQRIHLIVPKKDTLYFIFNSSFVLVIYKCWSFSWLSLRIFSLFNERTCMKREKMDEKIHVCNI